MSRTLLLMTVVSMSGLFACSQKDKLEPLQKLFLSTLGTVDVSAKFCTSPPYDAKMRLKMLFVIDKSSSNQNLPEVSDPDGSRRYGALMNLVTTATQDPNVYYGLINFSTGASVEHSFSNDLARFRQVVRNEWTGQGSIANPRPDDFGETDYLGALQAVRNEIERDLQETAASFGGADLTTLYQVIMVSDGYPLVQGEPQAAIAIQNIIQQQGALSVLSLKDDIRYRKYINNIVINTGYYHSTAALDFQARDLLENMSIWGGGDFHIFGAGVAIDYALFALPNRFVRYVLSDVWVENLSTVWWSDGTLKRDTDMDGMPDEIESGLGSNIEMKDTDGNGVSDFVEYRAKGKPCNDAACSRSPTLRDNYLPCQGVIASTSGDTILFGDRDRDQVNDCEEWVLRSDRELFDSNADRIPDGTALRNRLQFIAGTGDSMGDPDQDGMTNYAELKANTPLNAPNAFIPSIRYQLMRDQTNNDPTKECYILSAKDVATLGFSNTIRITVIHNQSSVENRPIITVAEGVVADRATAISFSEGDFK